MSRWERSDGGVRSLRKQAFIWRWAFSPEVSSELRRGSWSVRDSMRATW